MNFGKMDRRVTIQSWSTSRDAEGGAVKSWSTGSQVWAQVLQQGGREMFTHEQVNAEIDTLFRIRYSTSLIPDPQMRVVYNSTNFNIYQVRELGRGEAWEIMAKVNPL